MRRKYFTKISLWGLTIVILALVLLAALNGRSEDYRAQSVKYIKARDYYSAMRGLIREAEESIYLAVYLFKVDPSKDKKNSPAQLLEDLLEAHRRGVDVFVLLDQSYDYSARSKIDTVNDEAYDFLKKNGIKVMRDSTKTLFHSKFMVIDSKLVVIGSTNWTYSAFWFNDEASVIIASEELARGMISQLRKLAK